MSTAGSSDRQADHGSRMSSRLTALSRALSQVLAVALLLGLSMVTASTQASASFSWAANSWGECNTKRPNPGAVYSRVNFEKVVVPAGRPNNYYYATCRYWGYNGRFWVPIVTSVDWNRACALDAPAGYRWALRPDYSVWCTV